MARTKLPANIQEIAQKQGVVEIGEPVVSQDIDNFGKL